MAMEPFLHFSLLILSAATTAAAPPLPYITTTYSPLDPKQQRALRSMNTPISSTNPCSDSSALCDNATPFRHLLSLRLHNCSDQLSLCSTSLRPLSNLTTLELINCPINNENNPAPLSTILESFDGLKVLVVSNSNLTEPLPDNWNPELTHIDLSNNGLTGEIPASFKGMVCLKSLSLASNSLTGTVPSFLDHMGNLQYLNLENNNFKDSSCDPNKQTNQSWSTNAVRIMALALLSWLIFIVVVVVLANSTE